MSKKVFLLILIFPLVFLSCDKLKKKVTKPQAELEEKKVVETEIKREGFAGSEDALFHYNLATVLYNKHKYLEALDEFKKALELNPTDEIKLKSNLIIGAIYDDMGKAEEAVDAYRAAIAVEPNSLEAHYNLGTVLMKLKRFKEAVDEFQAALKIRKSDLESMINLGNCYLNLKNYEAAIGIYEEALKLKPDMPDIKYNLAYAYQEAGYYEKALKTYEQVITLDKTREISKLVYINMGSIYDERGEYDKAISAYKRGLALDPENTDIRFNLALVLMKKGLLTDALKQLQKIISIKKDDADAYLTMGNIYYDLRKYNEAKKFLTKAIELKPNVRAMLFLANIYFKEKKYQNARKYYEKIIAIEKNTETSRLAYIGLGDIFDNFGDYKSAIEYYKQAIKLSPDDPGLHYNLAVIYLKDKNIQECINELKEAIKIDPNNFNALKLLGDVLYNTGQIDEAMDYVKKALKIDEKDFDLNYLLANIYLKKDLPDLALDKFKKCLSLKPTPSQKKVIYVNIGNIYSSSKKYDVAIKYYQKAINIDPKYSTAYYNMAIANYNLGKIDAAISNLRDTIKYEPTNIDAHSLLGNLYYKKGMLNLAEQEYKAAIELGSKDIEVMDKLKEIRQIKQ